MVSRSQKRITAIVGLASYFIYIAIWNILNGLLSWVFKVKPKIIVVASYCRTGLPLANANKQFEIDAILMSLKFLLLVGLVLYRKRVANHFMGKLIMILMICFAFLELFSVMFFLFDKLFDTVSFKYFAALTPIYVLAEKTELFYLTIALNMILTFIAVNPLRKAIQKFHGNLLAKCFYDAALSLVLLILAHLTFRQVLNII